MANVLKTLAQTIVASSNMITTIAVRSESILDNSLAMLDDLAQNGHDYTHMAKLTNMTRRRKEFLKENADLDNVPPALQALLDMEIK